MKFITISLGFIGGLVSDLAISAINLFKKLIKIFTAMTLLFGVLFIVAAMFFIYFCCATAIIQKDDMDEMHVNEQDEMVGFASLVEEVV